MKFFKQVRDFGINLFNEEVVTSFNFGTFKLILASSVIVKLVEYLYICVSSIESALQSIEKLCCIFCFSIETVQDCELTVRSLMFKIHFLRL